MSEMQSIVGLAIAVASLVGLITHCVLDKLRFRRLERLRTERK
jgi:hypothetical protein